MSDLIDRDAAIDALRECQTYLFNTQDPDKKISLKSAEYAIEDLPSAQSERKRGNWKYNGKSGTFKIFTCDQCGRNSEAEFNFCPGCGADMRGEEDANANA